MVGQTPQKAEGRGVLLACAALAAVLLVGAGFGFVVVPLSARENAGQDPWTVICHALGLRTPPPRYVREAAAAGAPPVSEVSWTPATLDRLDAGDRKIGAGVVSDTCAACHGEGGVSSNAQFPTLAGQSAMTLYKQLHDYKTGARVNPIMAAIVPQLSERQMIDVAAYLSHDHAFHGLGPRYPVPGVHAKTLVERGDPARNLPACGACHGAATGAPVETPVLDGQSADYLRTQLQLYASGTRVNDIYGRMRRIAGKLTPAEMDDLAAYYQGLN
jgi:cytochrome c553